MKRILIVLFFTSRHGLTLTSDGHVGIESNDRPILTKIGIFLSKSVLERLATSRPVIFFKISNLRLFVVLR